MLCKKSEVLQKEIDDILETPLEFAQRKVILVIKSYQENNIIPTPTDVLTNANVHVHYPQLKSYIRLKIDELI